MSTKKTKLRTITDVLNRLNWDPEYQDQTFFIGYDDRIQGPLETPLQDYTPLAQGGDLPEHRIWYVRSGDTVLWDKMGRLDRIFGSGNGAEARLSHECQLHLEEAKVNMARLEKEKMERRAQKQAERARRAQKRGLQANQNFSSGGGVNPSTSSHRFRWQFVPSFEWWNGQFRVSRGSQREFEQFMLLLVGLPGSGKSTFAESLVNQRPWMYVRINQDALGSRHKCESLARNVLRDGKCPIIDRCNFDPSQRDHFLGIAGEFNVLVDCVVFHCNPDLCVQRCQSRRDHETIAFDTAQEAVTNMMEKFSPPLTNDSAVEKYHEVVVVDSQNEFDYALRKYLGPKADCSGIAGQKFDERDGLTFLTWNILFDVFDGSEEETRERWSALVSKLEDCDADVIALQEVTPLFVEILFGCEWVKDYAATCSLDDMASVSPHGNMILWKREVLSADAVERCMDGDRCRIIMALLRHGSKIFAISNLHLPANKGAQSRDVARRRELSAVLAKLQRTETTCKTPVTPVLLGDFNSGDDKLILGDSFIDTWRAIHKYDEGMTFDPENNSKAARTLELTKSEILNKKRLDRIFFGSGTEVDWDKARISLVGHKDDVPLSDHYGVLLSIPLETRSVQACMYRPGPQLINCWATNAVTTPDTLLGVILGQSNLGNRKIFDPQSSLPLPHITVLNGFVEIEGYDDLVKQALDDIVAETVQSSTSVKLIFSSDSLQVFEHRSSATLVCCPDMELEENQWLRNLYDGLRTVFVQCHEQESRFAEGWRPHLTLGNFGSASQAREAAKLYTDALRVKVCINVCGLTTFKRCFDGKFYANNAVSLVKDPRNTGSGFVRRFLKSSGRHWTEAFIDATGPIISELERACREIAGHEVSSTIVLYGSHKLNASIFGMSDIDAIIELSSSDNMELRRMESNFLQELMDFIKVHFPDSRSRFRAAGVIDKLRILTVKLWHNSPSVDLLVCCKCHNVPISASSSRVETIVVDTKSLVNHINSHRDLFQDCLRIIKLWSYRRQIYGIGFVGGGGWAIWLAKIIQENDVNDHSPLSLTALFFQKAMEQAKELPICVRLCESQEFDDDKPLRILPITSGTNLGRNATRSTAHVIQHELRRAVSLVSSHDIHGMEMALLPIDAQDFAVFESTIVVKVPGTGQPMAELKYRACNQVLSMLVALEFKIGDATLIRPFLCPLHCNHNLVWLIGVQCDHKDLEHFCAREEAAFKSAVGSSACISIECMESAVALQSVGIKA